MIGELVFLELAPDRGSEYVEDTLSKALDLCTAHDAQLLFVDFAQEGGWRHHPFMSRLMQLAPVSCMGLYPDPLMIDGLMFDPIGAFSAHAEDSVRPEAWPPRPYRTSPVSLPTTPSTSCARDI